MKKIILAILAVCLVQTASAKKVKFAVDMTGQLVSAFGVHVTGDFQTLAGFAGGDWASNTTPLTNEAGTDIYSIVVDIPAFAKYEYKFVNGDQFYEAEFVPVESRVGYNFVDNRWIWVDSLANDTTFVGAILFGGNAPAGLNLIRFLVDMNQQASVDPAGIHVAGTHQGWNPATTMLYSFEPGIYEIINYVTVGTYEYKYYNGNVTGTEETVPSACATNGNRSIVVSKDTVLESVCFASCSSCSTTGITANTTAEKIKLYPNPFTTSLNIEFENNAKREVAIFDLTGRKINSFSLENSSVKIERGSLSSGAYILNVKEENGKSTFARLIVE
jgi:hypothetical protein